MTLEISSLVSHDGIANSMGLVKGVVCKIHNFIVDGLGDAFRYPVTYTAGNSLFRITVDKNLSFRFDDFHFLFGNCPADVVGLSHGIAAQRAEYLNHLFLVDDASVSDFQDWFQQRRFIGHLPGIQLVGNKTWNRVHGTGTIQRHNCRNIFNRTGLHTDAHAGHTGGFQLKNALGLPLGKHGESFLVVVRNSVHGKIRLPLLNFLFGVSNNRQISQSQKIHFQKAQFLNGGHGVLGHNGIVIPG